MDITSFKKVNLALSPQPLKPVGLRSSFILFLFSICIPFVLSAQTLKPATHSTLDTAALETAKRVYLKVNPFTFLAGPIVNTSEYRLGLEFIGGERFTYEFHGSYLSKWVLLNTNLVDDTVRAVAQAINFPGFRAQVVLKYFLVKTTYTSELADIYDPNGIYLALHASYSTASLSIRGQVLPRQDWTNFQTTLRLGYEFNFDGDFGMDFFAGIGYKHNQAINVDTRSRRSSLNIQEELDSPLGDYLVSPIKLAAGFSLSFGLF